MSYMFSNCPLLRAVKIGDVSKVTNMDVVFSNCSVLNDITMLGNPVNVINLSWPFGGIAETGVFKYDCRYDYSKIIELLPPGWTAKKNYTPTACSELTITADDIKEYFNLIDDDKKVISIIK